MAATEALAARRPTWHYWIAALAAVLGVGSTLVIAFAVTGLGRTLPGFLGTNARLLADLNLVLQLFMAASLVVGFFLARRGSWRAHQLTMTAVVLVNLVLIAFVMGVAFFDQVVADPAPLTAPQRLSPVLHGIAGTVAQALGLYLLLRMYALIPARLRVRNFKRLMRLTFGLWLLVAAGGVSLYLTTYTGTAATAAPAAAGVATGAAAPTAAARGGAYGYGGAPSASGQAASGQAASGQVQPTAQARPAQSVTVGMANFAFGPRELTVKAGTTVSFTNGDRAPHTATADGGQFDTGNIAPGGGGAITLTQTGTFRFFCRLHGAAGGQGMSGTITVQP